MLKKIIAYQKLLSHSNTPFNSRPPNSLTIVVYCFVIATMVFMNSFIFFGDTMSSTTFLATTVPIILIWMTNKVLYGNKRLFETVPVSRKFTVLNVFFFPIVTMFIAYITVLFLGAVFVGIIFISSHGINEAPPQSAMHQIIDTSKGNLLMILIFLIIIFVAMAITFVKSKKLRLSSFAAFAAIGYGLLFLLKHNMPVSPTSNKVEFLESFSIMPQGTTILICVAIATVIISITSVLIGCKLYVDN